MSTVAWVLGGGGLLGATEAGMAQALLETGIVPDLVLGTSIGAINGAVLASDPTPAGAVDLATMWEQIAGADVLAASAVDRMSHWVRNRTSLHSNDRLAALLTAHLPATFSDLAVRFECVAASIGGARETWFSEGPLVEAVLASAALPGVFPAVQIGDEHYFDGGLVNSVPIGRALRHGADTIWVLHVGRVEERLHPPRFPWEVGFVAFEIARRHRFHRDLSELPDGVTVHVLPTGLEARDAATWSALRYRNPRRIGDRAERAHRATAEYLQRIK
ncbi:MAG TPA: patatin-like phospholipase family protein [Mycobacteriales bacterium]|nr:patatin-like phospholipase family protein [Mycobacteriales bacterium]